MGIDKAYIMEYIQLVPNLYISFPCLHVKGKLLESHHWGILDLITLLLS